MPHDPTDYSQFLQDLNEFNVLKITEEDQKRGEMYSQELERKYLKNLSYSLENFLQELEIKMKFLPADQFTIPRISQLTLKTNQFNLTTKRYQEEDIQKFSDDKNMIVECVKIEDKFGNNGITGVYIIRKNNSEEWLLDTFLLSCRIMGKDIEKGILAKILQKAKDEGVKKVKMQYIPTKKNKPVEEFLPNTGFTNEGDYWVFDLKNEIMSPKHLEVI
jgi:FkbH-like protein